MTAVMKLRFHFKILLGTKPY